MRSSPSSRQLAQLRELGLVADRREGLWVYYRIHPAPSAWARRVLEETAAGMRNRFPFAEDEQALARMPNRPSGQRCAWSDMPVSIPASMTARCAARGGAGSG